MLKEYAKNFTSQWGEDGIIGRILEILPDNDKWCVEFGAWDGILFSNTRHLINIHDYNAVLIEANKDKYQELVKNNAYNKKMIPVNKFVSFDEGEDHLDFILNKTDIPINFDLLSIDIDGNDYHIWDSIQKYKPKIVCIEYNPTVPNNIEFIQERNNNVTQGCSLLALMNLAREKGYKMVAATITNGIFVDEKYYDLFNIENDSIDAFRPKQEGVTFIYTGYDGEVFVTGNTRMVWHYRLEYKVQQLPKFLRRFPDNYNFIQRFCFMIFFYLRKFNLI